MLFFLFFFQSGVGIEHSGRQNRILREKSDPGPAGNVWKPKSNRKNGLFIGWCRGGFGRCRGGFLLKSGARWPKKCPESWQETVRKKQVKTLQNTSLKLPPNTRKLFINHPVRKLTENNKNHKINEHTRNGRRPDWFICNLRVFGGSFREVFWIVLSCFSDSCPSIFRPFFL